MSIDYSKLHFLSSLNTFKNKEVHNTGITLTGTIGAGAEKTFTRSITLTENQKFVFAQAKFAEFTKAETGGITTKYWQPIPTFDIDAPSTPIGFLAAYLYVTVNGLTITFTAGMLNPYAGTETIVDQTIPISYVTYTLAR